MIHQSCSHFNKFSLTRRWRDWLKVFDQVFNVKLDRFMDEPHDFAAGCARNMGSKIFTLGNGRPLLEHFAVGQNPIMRAVIVADDTVTSPHT